MEYALTREEGPIPPQRQNSLALPNLVNSYRVPFSLISLVSLRTGLVEESTRCTNSHFPARDAEVSGTESPGPVRSQDSKKRRQKVVRRMHLPPNTTIEVLPYLTGQYMLRQ
jgi:hypothetical protein